MLNYQSRLLKVSTPAQYVGGEVNTLAKKKDAQKIALAFPDLYEIGMSNLGLQILREVVNGLPAWQAERVFLPAPDLEKELRMTGLPLVTLETGTPLKNCAVIGISLAAELHAVGIPALLELGGVAPFAADRDDNSPIVIAGGHCVFNPEPFVDFIDAFVIGDGEDALPEILQTLQTFTRTAKRTERLTALAKIAGVYVPSRYPAQMQNEIVAPQCKHKITRRRVEHLDAAPAALRPLVPLVETAHERIALEIMRGCPNGCRFCQAGMINRPLRYRSVETLINQAEQIYACTGYDEIGLLSLSTSDYPELDRLTEILDQKFAPRGVGLSLPSLRVNEKLFDLPRRFQTVRKSGLTLAPEAGSERLRAVINKKVADVDLLTACAEAFRQGWQSVKLYFMIGLPTETDDDIAAIAKLCAAVADLSRRVKINCAVSNFVPKPWTPLQWLGMDSPEKLRAKQNLLWRLLKHPRVNCKTHDIEISVAEAAIARGDRRMGKVIYAAYQKGARLDYWSEHFSATRWHEAFAENNLTSAQFAERVFDLKAALAWSHIDGGVSEEFLRRELERSQRAQQSPTCVEQCSACGIKGCPLQRP